MGKKIRAIALGLIEHKNHIFVSRGRDPVTEETFYRFLGGGIEFGETSTAALSREFMEEVRAELTAVEYVTCLDNIFTYNGKTKHELIQLFRAQFVSSTFYRLEDTFDLVEGDRVEQAFWLATDKVFSGDCRLVPESCIKYIKAQNNAQG
ncbi:MAG: NUDIX domain-containing protein [Cyanobacteria bacterium J06649_4]